MHTTVKEMPESERPYEKCMKYGVGTLSDAELLAVIIRCGAPEVNSVELARNVITQCGGRDGIAALERKSLSELKSLRGIGDVKAVQLKALSEFAKRLWRNRRTESPRYNKPERAAAYYMEELRRLSGEEVHIMYLDNKCSLLEDYLLSKGTVNSSIVSTRDIFIHALKCEAVKFIMVHNHPSGDPTPSKDDLEITRKVIAAGVIMDIRLSDSIVIGDGVYVSIRESDLVEFA